MNLDTRECLKNLRVVKFLGLYVLIPKLFLKGIKLTKATTIPTAILQLPSFVHGDLCAGNRQCTQYTHKFCPCQIMNIYINNGCA